MVGHRRLMNHTLVLLVLAFGARKAAAAPEGATLSLSPTCGTADTTIIHLKGRGWHPGSACDSIKYEYFWDDHQYLYSEASLANCPELGFSDPENRVTNGPQDHLTRGPWFAQEIDNARPDICLKVPADYASVGKHVLRVELFIRIGGNAWMMRKCVERDWRVTDVPSPDPWSVVANLPSNCAGSGPVDIRWKFDPANVCDIPKTSEIVFIQAIKLEGDYLDGTTRELSATRMGFNQLVDLGVLKEASGYFIDVTMRKEGGRYFPSGDPYGNGFKQIGFCNGQPGLNDPDNPSADSPSLFTDSPGTGTKKLLFSTVSDSVTVIRMRFLDSIFCAEGEGKGIWLGNAGWVWEFPRAAQVPTISAFPGDRFDAPDSRLDGALSAYDGANTWDRPLPDDSQRGGRPCGTP